MSVNTNIKKKLLAIDEELASLELQLIYECDVDSLLMSSMFASRGSTTELAGDISVFRNQYLNPVFSSLGIRDITEPGVDLMKKCFKKSGVTDAYNDVKVKIDMRWRVVLNSKPIYILFSAGEKATYLVISEKNMKDKKLYEAWKLFLPVWNNRRIVEQGHFTDMCKAITVNLQNQAGISP